MTLAWDRSLSMGVDELDDQHREIITRMRVLGDAIGADQREAMVRAASELVRCVSRHFRIEERCMRVRGYPRLSSHAQVHELGLQALSGAVRLCALEGPSERFLEQVERSARWLDVHLRSEDLALGNFLRDHAPAPSSARRARALAR
jgi:hemerythrin